MNWLCSVGVVLCVVVSNAQEELPWWRTAVLYQVYPRSFKDSDGDGVGDLKGITQKADYFKEIGVDAIWLSPIYKSPMIDMGYDISDFISIDPLFGTMEDFDALSAKLKSIGVRMLMDMVPNHSSDQHTWFQSSRNRSDPNHADYDDFYIWKDPKGWVNGTVPVPPNNWTSVFDGTAWQWCEERQQFYLHQFKPQQPDLNYRNDNLLGNMTESLKFWMKKGVSGFRVDAAKYVYESDTFKDQPAVPGTDGSTYEKQQHIYTEDQPETFQLMTYWTEVVRNYSLQDGIERAMWLEIYDPTITLMKYYGTGNNSMTMPFNFGLMAVDQSSRSSWVQLLIELWMYLMPSDGTASWVIGNHDNKRVADKCGPEMVDAMNLLTGILPGVKVSYYGEEIGMQDTFIRPDQVTDNSIYARDPFRTPMQWDDTPNAGFSASSSMWLPVNPNYWWLNVEAQRSAESSHLKVFQAMTKARKDPVLQRGDLNVLVPDNDTLIVVRYYNDSYYAFLMNVGSETRSYTSASHFTPNKLDIDMEVVVGSLNSGYKPGKSIKRRTISLTLRPKACVLLRSVSDNLSSSSTTNSISLLAFLVTVFIVLSRR